MSFSLDSRLTTEALEMAWERRGKPSGVMFHSDQGSHYTSNKQAVTVAIPDQTKYEQALKLLG